MKEDVSLTGERSDAAFLGAGDDSDTMTATLDGIDGVVELAVDLHTGEICGVSVSGLPEEDRTGELLGKGFVNCTIGRDSHGKQFLGWMVDVLLSGRVDPRRPAELPAVVRLVNEGGFYLDLRVATISAPDGQNVVEISGTLLGYSCHMNGLDGLTHMPNVTFIQAYLSRLLRSSDRESVCVLVLDIDRFSTINETYGFEFGDDLLEAVGDRLNAAFGSEVLVGRLYADVFVVVMTDVSSDEFAARIARQVQSVLAKPFKSDGRPEISLTSSIGVARVTSNSTSNAAEVLAMAVRARGVVKRSGFGGIEFYDGQHFRESSKRISDEMMLRRAVIRGEIGLVYLPIYSMNGMGIVAAEALMRWDHPDRGQIGAAEFASIAEEAGIGRELSRQVVAMAVEQASAWWTRFPGLDLRIDVNIAESYLRDSSVALELIQILDSRVGEYLPIWLDVSVGSLSNSSWERGEAQLRALSEYGLGLSLDNLGEDGAGLSLLARLQFNQVKLASSLVAQVDKTERARIVVGSAVRMIKDLGSSACAVGVENSAQLNILRECGVDFVAGYQVGRPMSVEGFEMQISLNGLSV